MGLFDALLGRQSQVTLALEMFRDGKIGYFDAFRLVDHDSRPIEGLLAALRNRDPVVRAHAAQFLGSFARWDARRRDEVAQALENALQDVDTSVRAAAEATLASVPLRGV